MSLNNLAYLLLISSVLFCSCARQTSISDLISSKKHDRDGIYYVEYKKPQEATPINAELASLGYTVKDGYYWNGLEKKTDKYKFLWFYGKEYESLKEVRTQERSRDSLLANKNMVSFLQAQNQFPQFPIENPEEEALKYLRSMEDITLYHGHYGDKNIDKTEPIAQPLISSVENLHYYRNVYGVSEFTENKIKGFLNTLTRAEAKILIEHFADSRHIEAIELIHLSKSKDISTFAKATAAKKYFDLDPSFPFESKKAVASLKERLDLKLLAEEDIDRLTSSLYDLHIDKNTSTSRNDFQRINQIMTYAENNADWLGDEYVQNKEVSLIKEINKSKFGRLQFFNQFQNEINKVLQKWVWTDGYRYSNNLILIDSYKGSLRKEQKETSSNSAIDAILFEKLDNMLFSDIVPDTEIDDLSYVRLSGKYTLVKDKKSRLPFHAIFKLDDKSKEYSLTELVITNLGVNNTHSDGKKKNHSLYYDKSNGSLKRKG